MLIEFAFAAATITLPTITLPPMTLSVHVAPGIPSKVVTQTLEEAAAIWRQSGVTLMFDGRDCAGAVACAAPSVRMNVTFDDDAAGSHPDALPIGWIGFDEFGDPTRQIHLSLGNAMSLIEGAEGVGTVSRMTTFERHVLLSRTLGRALAHEIGHFVLSTKSHTKSGLMKAHRLASDFLGPGRGGFEIDESQKTLIAARLLQAAARSMTSDQ